MKQLEKENAALRRALKAEERDHARTREISENRYTTQKALLAQISKLESDVAHYKDAAETAEVRLKEAERNGEQLFARLEVARQIIDDAICRRGY